MAFVVSASKEVLSTSPFPPDQFMLSVDLGTRKDDHSLTYVDSMLWPLHYGNAGLPLHYANAGYYDDVTGLFQNLTLINGEAMQVWVDYDGRATVITVTIAPLGLAKPKKPLLHTIIDLSGVAQSTAYVGFSSAGMPRTKYFVLGWSFALDGSAPVLDISTLPNLPPAPVLDISVLPALQQPGATQVGIGTYIFVRQRLKYSEVHEDWEVPFGPNRFSYKELFHATEGFSDKNLLGRGGFGSVYKGVLRKPDMEVAVKRMSHDSRQGVKEFIAEVVSIGRLRHRNLTQLLGYCRCKGELLLVYEYMANGSLDKYLHNRNGLVLDWPQRYGIIKGVASSLFYLHEKWEHVVIHRDIKPSNVLLDSQMNGRLGDFGLARIYNHETAAPATHVAGTIGYLAPELARTGKPTPFTDVYAFGMFLLEVTCGRKPIFTGEQNNRLLLVEWVLEHHRDGSILDTVDPRLQGEFSMEEVTIVLKLGLICTYPLPNVRPIMRKVMQYLVHNQLPPDLSPAYISYMSLMQSEGFNSDNMNTTCSEAAVSVATVSSATILRHGR
ncbi:L-type lectin-domain containing receptor kinase IV.2 [Triticum urartu]|uniref:non-specific serine/threonine protein kinase n=1 Tax=Triticum urartu TaxID=4572 RepID=M7ZSM0_TRIUA|nr:L-type lectin-domain containing receptor kinase IV.2 [Triticum urartu]